MNRHAVGENHSNNRSGDQGVAAAQEPLEGALAANREADWDRPLWDGEMVALFDEQRFGGRENLKEWW